MRSSTIVATPVLIGPFFVGNTAPDIRATLTYDTGGYVPLNGASAVFTVRKWDPLRREPWGSMVTGGICSFGNVNEGEVIYSWSTAAIPTTPGWYCARFVVTFADSSVQDSQDLIFEVQEGAPVA